MFGPSWPGHVSICSVHHQYSSSVSPFQAKTGMPASADGGGGVVLRREDVARRPADLGAERDQRLDEDGRLDRHVQRAGDARALERLGRRVLLAGAHQAGHLVLGELDLLAAEGGEAQIGDLEVGRGRVGRNGGRGHPVSVTVGVGRRGGGGEQPLVLVLLPAQPVGRRDVLGAPGLGLEPGVDRAPQVGVAAQPAGEADLRQADLEALQQLAQRAQALQLGGAVEAVAAPERAGSTRPMRST